MNDTTTAVPFIPDSFTPTEYRRIKFLEYRIFTSGVDLDQLRNRHIELTPAEEEPA